VLLGTGMVAPYTRPLRVLCVRELQNSMAESCHRVLADQIGLLGLDAFYDIQRDRIIGRNGTVFSFEGIKNNVTKIKSYEGVDICWAEEAVKITKNSWSVLEPTIRKPGSEIWLSFNPELEEDYTYQRFVVNATSDSVVVFMCYRDNPWFPETLRVAMAQCRERDYDEYMNVWEGHCRQLLDGAVYAAEMRRAQLENRLDRVPYQRDIPVDVAWDLGRTNHTSLWFGQRVAMQYRVLDFYEASGQHLSHYLRECQVKGYLYGTMWLPHDATHKRLGAKHSIEAQVRTAGHTVRIVPRLKVEPGINAARAFLDECWFDRERCADGLTHLRKYAYGADGTPLHDEHSDAADAFRYLALAQGRDVRNAEADGVLKRLNRAAQRYGRPQGWMR
jgi:phage terminase large subunit